MIAPEPPSSVRAFFSVLLLLELLLGGVGIASLWGGTGRGLDWALLAVLLALLLGVVHLMFRLGIGLLAFAPAPERDDA